MKKTICDEMAGKVFKENNYEFRVFLRKGSLGDAGAYSLSIFLENEPDIIAPDLILLAIRAVLRANDQMENKTKNLQSAEVIINKISMEDNEPMGNLLDMMKLRPVLHLQPFAEVIDNIEKIYKTNSIQNHSVDFTHANHIASIRKQKVEKALAYMNKTTKEVVFQDIDGVNKMIPMELVWSVTPIVKKTNMGGNNNYELSPSLDITINCKSPNIKNIQGSRIGTLLSSQIRATFMELTPIEFHSYDRLTIS